MNQSLPSLGKRNFLPKSKKAPGECLDCRWSTHEQTDLVCRRHPPQVSIIVSMNGITGKQQPVSMAAFPIVKPDMWCGEFAGNAAPIEAFDGGAVGLLSLNGLQAAGGSE